MQELRPPSPEEVQRAMYECLSPSPAWPGHLAAGSLADKLVGKGLDPVGQKLILHCRDAHLVGIHFGEVGPCPPGEYQIAGLQKIGTIGNTKQIPLIDLVMVGEAESPAITVRGDAWVFLPPVKDPEKYVNLVIRKNLGIRRPLPASREFLAELFA